MYRSIKYISPQEDDNLIQIHNNNNDNRNRHCYEGINFREYLILQSDDDIFSYHSVVEYVVHKDIIKQHSELIRDILDDQEEGEINNNNIQQNIIPLPNINGRTLGYIVQYMVNHHHCTNETMDHNNNIIPKPLPTDAKLEDFISKWDNSFLNTDLVKNGNEKEHELLLDVILAANFLKIQSLLELGCAKIADMIKERNPEQIRELFDIKEDFSYEEKEKIKQEQYWIQQ